MERFPGQQNWGNLNGYIPKLTEEPTYTPRGAFEQLVVVSSGGSTSTYIYDVGAKAWVRIEVMGASANTTAEVFFPAEAMNPTTTAGCAALAKVEAGTNDVDYWVLDFDAATDENAFFTVKMPDDWDAGTITFKFIWTNASGLSTETVSWNIKGRCYADSDAIDQTYGTAIAVTDTWLAQGDIHISAESAAVTPAGTLAAGQWAQFKIYRDVSEDTLTGDARLIGVRMRYEKV